MPELIRYETKSDRELLIVVAEAINSLNEKTADLCEKVSKHESYINENKNKLSNQEIEIHDIVYNNARVTMETTKTLNSINEILTQHIEIIADFKTISRLFWWIVGAIGTIITAVIIYLITNFKYP